MTTLSPAERTRQHLAELEAKGRAEVAAATVGPEPHKSNRLNAAILYRDGTRQRHAELLTVYRASQERLAAYTEPRRSLADRLLGRQTDPTCREALERDVAAARKEVIAGEKMAAQADGNLARAEKADAAERAHRAGQMEAQRHNALEMLGEVVMAQRIARAFPVVVYCGPLFVAWSGRKLDRKRRKGLRHSGATNIWGIPLDFG